MTRLKSSEIKCVADEASATEFIITRKDKTEFCVLAYDLPDAMLTVDRYIHGTNHANSSHPELFE